MSEPMAASGLSWTKGVANSGTFQLGEWTVRRMGYGAMRLSGKMIYGPPDDPAHAAKVLRTAVASGVNHIDTSDYYGPHHTNQLIREALHPYPADLVLVTKIGNRRAPDKSWPVALGREEMIAGVHDNLRHLGLDALHVVNLRVGGPNGPVKTQSVAEPFGVLAELQQQGLIRHLGISNCTPEQMAEAQAIAPVVCVQNSYNVAQRGDDAFVDLCAAQGIAYVPFFPLGGFAPLRQAVLKEVAAELGVSVMQVALAWLLQRSPNMLLIPGTSKVEHLKENLAAGGLMLGEDVVAKLEGVGKK
jgi:aryl-alcohol dehydrogenase-like predicted oxidoreductase